MMCDTIAIQVFSAGLSIMPLPSTNWTEDFSGNSLDLTGYTITFRDEFDSLSISNGRGEANWYSGIHTDFGLARFARGDDYLEPFSVSDGVLNIRMDNENGKWESGLLQTVNSKTEGFKQSYGYFEMRAKFPEELGAWPAFWLISEEDRYDKSKVRVEIDTVEAYSNSPRGFHGHIHYTPNESTQGFNKKISGGLYEQVGSLFDDQFHTYGTMITPQWVITYFDGREIGRVAASDYTSSPFYMIIDLAMFRDPGDTSIVYDMEIDYVRAYARTEQTNTPPVIAPVKSGTDTIVDAGGVSTPDVATPATSGDDDLHGTTGSDIMAGGEGDDTYWVNHVADVVVERARSGNDTINSSIDYTLSANVENLKLYGAIAKVAIGNASSNVLAGNGLDNMLLGLGGNDELRGYDGADRLDGGLGADAMTGGRGDDVYVVDNVGDRIIEMAGEGRDTVYSSVSFAVRNQSIETVVLTGNANARLTGGNYNDILVGNSGRNIINGGRGGDTMSGGAGDDTYYIDDPYDKVVELEGEGHDTLYTPFATVLKGTNIEVVYLTGTSDVSAYGSFGDDGLYGNNGNNLLNGLSGADLMAGNGGDDTYWVDDIGDRVIERASGGYDTVLTTVSFDARGQSVEKIDLRGDAAINVVGSADNNTIIGNDAANSISGGLGNDWLSGRGGKDVLTGGGGSDTFVFETQLGFHLDDQITDFQHGVDKIALSTKVFAALGGPGALAPNLFEVGSSSSTPGSHIVYNDKTGTIYYDADGNASPAWLPIVTVAPGMELTGSDFIVI
jgi:Ca2+-binding RTX toxin-like protein